MIDWRDVKSPQDLAEFNLAFKKLDQVYRTEIMAEMAAFLDEYAGFDRIIPINNASTSRQEPLRQIKRPRGRGSRLPRR